MSEMKTYSFSIQHPELTVQGKFDGDRPKIVKTLLKKIKKSYKNLLTIYII